LDGLVDGTLEVLEEVFHCAPVAAVVGVVEVAEVGDGECNVVR